MKQRWAIAAWRRAGSPSPPPHAVKQRTLKGYAKTYGLQTFVETGTLHGDMVEAMRPYFSELYSIELSPALASRARQRFDGDDNVRIIEGDSARELRHLLSSLAQPALFWLDGHYSGGETAHGEKATPIMQELEDLLGADPLEHVIVIDDARCFGGEADYPTLDELIGFVKRVQAQCAVEVRDDMIRILPSAATH